MPEQELREQIARIVDPRWWYLRDLYLLHVSRERANLMADSSLALERRGALFKADQIIALLPKDEWRTEDGIPGSPSSPPSGRTEMPHSAGWVDDIPAEVLIEPSTLQDLLRAAFVAGCEAVHANHQPHAEPDFTEAAWDYVAISDFMETTRPHRAAPSLWRSIEMAPAGWKLVPDEPTREMVDFAQSCAAVADAERRGYGLADTYRDMVYATTRVSDLPPPALISQQEAE